MVTVVELDPGDGLRGGEGDVEQHAAHLAAPRQRGHGLGHRHQQPGGGHVDIARQYLEDNEVKCASYKSNIIKSKRIAKCPHSAWSIYRPPCLLLRGPLHHTSAATTAPWSLGASSCSWCSFPPEMSLLIVSTLPLSVGGAGDRCTGSHHHKV